MPDARIIHQVVGDPERIASRLAVRLRHLGDHVQVVSASEFVYSPQPAERALFYCPRQVRVVVLPADLPGHSLVVLEPRGADWWRWRWPARLAAAAVTAVAAWGLWGSPPAALCGTAVPLLMAIVAPWLLDSGWRGRLASFAQQGLTPGLERVPATEHWLSLSEPEREAVIAELRATAEEMRRAGGQWAGADRRSDEERLGWPLWHRAYGRDPVTGESRCARGWLAVGQLARGRVAIGQVASGWLAIGQAARGLLTFAQVGAGVVALGQVAISALAAAGQIATGLFAAGQIAFGAITAGQVTGDDLLAFWYSFFAVFVTIGLAVKLIRVRTPEQESVERQLAERGEVPLPDDASLSLSDRLTADPQRGLSPAEVELDS